MRVLSFTKCSKAEKGDKKGTKKKNMIPGDRLRLAPFCLPRLITGAIIMSETRRRAYSAIISCQVFLPMMPSALPQAPLRSVWYFLVAATISGPKPLSSSPV